MRSIRFILLAVLVSAALVASLEQEKKGKGDFISQLIDLVTAEAAENKDFQAESSCFSCILNLVCLEEASEDLKFCSSDAKSSIIRDTNSNKWFLLKDKVQKFIEVHPNFKQILLDCLNRNKHLFHVSGLTIIHPLFLKHILSRKHLRESMAHPTSDSEPLPNSPGTVPSRAPTASPGSIPQGLSSRQLRSQPPSSKNASSRPYVLYDQTSGGESNERSLVIAVSVSSAVTFVFAALFFLSCSKICIRGHGGSHSDERPLHTPSMADCSTGSSLNASGSGNSVKEEELSHQDYSDKNEKLSIDSISSNASSDGISVGASGITGNQGIGPVPLPSGRMSSCHFFKPPPGRAEPGPPEPAASIAPPPIKASPPPAPPPPPPPPAKISDIIATQPPGRPPPPPPPMPPCAKPGPSPPNGSVAPQPPPLPLGSKVPRPPLLSKPPSKSASGEGSSNADGAPKTKLKPFFWDKVLANPNRSMVWDQIKSGSFQFNEETIETLFSYAPADNNKNENKKKTSQIPAAKFVQIIDPKKAQNLSILLRALNLTTEEVCDALMEGNELPAELLQTMLRMAPTEDEELKLRLFDGELSQLGTAEQFLKALVDIPFAFKRMEVLIFMCTLHEEVTFTKQSFETLEVASEELRNNRLFLKLLEAVLKTGNRMNDGTFRGGAQAFKLDTLLKLSDVKGTDGKTTLLHFVVQEIIRSEGVRATRAAGQSHSPCGVSVETEDLLDDISPETEGHYRSLGLQVVSHLSQELENVKKAAIIDANNLTGTVSKLDISLVKCRDFLNKEMKSLEEESGFHQVLKSFVEDAEVDIMSMMEEEKRIMGVVKSTGDYFHGNAGKDEGLRLFVVVRDFLIVLDKVCNQLRVNQKGTKNS